MLPKSEITSELDSYIAPHILGNKLLKQFLTLQMFTNPNDGEKLHILIIGGASSGKTEIAKYLCKVTRRSAFVSRGASFAGLRDVLLKNPEVIFIDEFDKLEKRVREALLQAMSIQSVNITLKGQNQNYKAEGNITALANPIRSELTDGAPLYSQISFSNEIPLLSRFHFLIPVFEPESFLYGDIAERMENKRYTEEEIIGRIREILITIKFEYPSIKVDLPLARKVGEYVKQLRETVSDNTLIKTRLIEGFLSAIKARARMCQRKEANESDLDYIKSLYSQLL